MPRIDPIKLLECLSVLLSPTGGIKSRGEVERLANLMTKFSKKLVSKCIYIQILKCTDTEILRMFMGSGGWLLVHMWLTESIVAKNWPLVRELLELLLLCPVDIERLKTNNCPKLVKELSKDGNHFAIRALATKLVEQWLKTVKGEQVVPIQLSDITQIVSESEFASNFSVTLKNEDNAVTKIKTVSDVQNTPHTTEEEIAVAVKSDEVIAETNDVIKQEKDIKDEQIEDQENLPVLRISLKEGKQVISQVEDIECKLSDGSSDTEKAKDKSKTKNKVKSSERSSSSSKSNSSKYSSKSHSSSNDKHKGSSSHKSSSSSRHSSKDRSRDKEKDKYKSSSHSSKSKSDSNSKRSNDKSNSSMKSKDDKSSKQVYDKEKNKVKLDKEKQAQKTSTEKTEEKPLSPSIHKLGKIPKLSDVKKEKPSISIEVRKPDDPKPKTVKTFHSKFRRHGLEEEIKPPPSRAALLSKKVTPVLPPTIPKRPSPVHNETPPEKKAKTIEIIEKPGAIKLIPPKPKRFSSCAMLYSVASSSRYSLHYNFTCGKSKMYNITVPKCTSLVKYFLQINAEYMQYKSFVQY